jgi:RNA polymerase sigma-70 factor (ECF subfamily)
LLQLYISMLESDDEKERFSHLYQMYHQKMYRIAFSILKSKYLAEDALQQTWLSIIERFEKISQISGDEMEPYIVTIVKNASLDILRREKRTVLTDEQIEESYEPDINGELEFQRLVSLIRSMPGHYRNVLVPNWS